MDTDRVVAGFQRNGRAPKRIDSTLLLSATLMVGLLGSIFPEVVHARCPAPDEPYYGEFCYADADGDGAGSSTTTTCRQLDGSCLGTDVSNSGDCDDSDPDVHPGHTERCNGTDHDCDGTVDEGFDVDGDGVRTCDGDCDDIDAAIHPGATEVCNSIDDDCDGSTDEDAGTSFFADSDGDGFGDASSTTTACSAPSGYVTDGTDCDDTAPTVNPGATEDCGNGVDDNCDGSIDGADDDCSCTDGETRECYTAPVDTRGVGVCSAGTQTCASGSFGECGGEVTPTDEACDGADDDCDGTVDESPTDCGADEVCTAGACVPTEADGGPGGGIDAGLTTDAGAGTDAGSGGDDAGAGGDLDGGAPTMDAGITSDPAPSDGGCGCVVGGGRDRSPAVLAFLLVMGLCVLRRRRR